MNVLIIDDHALFREGLRHILKQVDPGTVISEAKDCAEAMKLAEDQPDLDLILLDLIMKGSSGTSALSGLRKTVPDVPIVIVSAIDSSEIVRETIKSGAQGFIPKSSTSKVMVSALQLVLSGGVYIPPELLNPVSEGVDEHALDYKSGEAAHSKHGVTGLTIRQLEVLTLICKGMSNKEICRALGLSEGTVKIHVTAILRALNVSNRTQAVISARELGFIAEG